MRITPAASAGSGAAWRATPNVLARCLTLALCCGLFACAEAPAQPPEALAPSAPARPPPVPSVVREPEPARAVETRARELTWSFSEGPFGPTEVVVSIPASADPAQRFPVLVAFHGRGESVKRPQQGARGWLDDYQLSRAFSRLVAPPLTQDDFEGFVSGERLGAINQGLAAQPYRGLIVVCPYLADVLKGAPAFDEAEPLARFVVDVLLPRVYAKSPAIGTPQSTGIDGVSLGGRAALLVGSLRPGAFGSVAGLQPAIDDSEVERFAGLLKSSREQNPKLYLRLLTSDEDYFLPVVRRLSRTLASQGIGHDFSSVLGTHSYRFNRGPGSFEMLLFHDRVLRGLPPI